MNLIYKHGHLRHGTIYQYPDGQQNVKLDMNYFDNPKESVKITCSVRNFSELEILLCIVAALQAEDFIIEQIKFVYLFGLRSDRKFEPGTCNYVKDVLSPIIKRLESVSVYPIKILQPHGRSQLYITNSHSRFDLGYHHTLPDEFKHFQKIAGDTSAFDIVNCQNSVYRQFPLHFVKTRKEHEISLHIPDSQYHEIKNDERPILIMDDLCDGGATFIVEAEYLRDSKLLGDRKLYLFVYHGLFTNGLDTLLKHFDRIYTTNSYRDYPALDQLKVIDVWS